MQPAGNDVFVPAVQHVAHVSVGPLGRPDQGLALLRLYRDILVDETGSATVFHVVQVGHPRQHPMRCSQRGPLRMNFLEMSTGVVALDVELSHLGPRHNLFEEWPLFQVVLMAGKQGIQVIAYGAVIVLVQFVGSNRHVGGVLGFQVYAAGRVALEQLGRLDEAVDSFRKALELNPDYAEAAGSLGSVLLSQGKLEEGLAMEDRGFGVIGFDLEKGVSIEKVPE